MDCRFFAKGQCTKGAACPFLHPSLPPPPPPKKECLFYLAGKCTKGAACPFLHHPSLPPPPSPPLKKECQFYLAGKCTKGAACPFLHPSLPPPPKTKVCQFYLADKCTKGHNCPFTHAAPAAAGAEEDSNSDNEDDDDGKEAGELTVQLMGATGVTFGPGASVKRVHLNEAGSKRVAINGLTAGVKDFSLQNALQLCGAVTDFSRPHESYALVTFSAGTGAAACVRELHDKPFQAGPGAAPACVLRVRVLPNPDSATPLDALALKLSWFAPSRACFLQFTTRDAAAYAAKKCHDQTLPGSGTVTAVTQAPGVGAKIFSVTLSGVGEAATEASVTAWLNSMIRRKPDAVASVKQVVLKPPAFRDAEGHVEQLLCSLPGYVPRSLAMLPLPTVGNTALRKAVARFSTAAEALAALQTLQLAGPQVALGQQTLRVSPVLAAKFTMLNGAYEALHDAIDATLASHKTALQHVTHRGPVVTVLKIRGSAAKPLAEAKQELDRLLAGECIVETVGGLRRVPLWCPLFDSRPASDALLRGIGAATGAFVQRNNRCRELSLFGPPAAVAAARAAVVDVAAQYRAAHHTILLPSAAARRHFAAECKRMPNVTYDAAFGTLVVSGDAAAAALVSDQVAAFCATASAAAAGPQGAAECPLCFCPVDPPAMTLAGCGHTYCVACFEHWLREASRFPLVCVADGCGRPLSLRQLRAFLQHGFEPLLRLALDEHVNTHRDEFRFCITPDCPQIYATTGDRATTCSSCLVAICTRCHVPDHTGLTCAAFAACKTNDDGDGDRAVRNHIVEEYLTNRCPKCTAAFYDFNGCFALTCGCGAHFCGWCLTLCLGDAHEHVRSCAAKLSTDPYFGTEAQFKASTAARISQRLTAYLDTLAPAARARALAAVKRDLDDLKIHF